MSKKLIKKALLDPLKTLSLINRRYFRLFRESNDKMINYEKSWIYGKLKRVSLNDVFKGIENISIKLISPYCGAFNMSPTVNELTALCAITKFIKAKNIVEVGTYDGLTTLNLIANMSFEGKIITIDLPINFTDYQLNISQVSDNRSDANKIGEKFKGSEYENRIKQVFQDSASINYEEYINKFDIFFIDGCHDYKYVKCDTENALKTVKKNGVIIWHDYGMIKDVSRYVDNLSKEFKIYAIENTRLALTIL